jgi:hypothetical protein
MPFNATSYANWTHVRRHPPPSVKPKAKTAAPPPPRKKTPSPPRRTTTNNFKRNINNRRLSKRNVFNHYLLVWFPVSKYPRNYKPGNNLKKHKKIALIFHPNKRAANTMGTREKANLITKLYTQLLANRG